MLFLRHIAGLGDLQEAFGAYKNARERRVVACRTISMFTQLLSDYPEVARLMPLVPGPINSAVFDAVLWSSLTGLGSYRPPSSLM